MEATATQYLSQWNPATLRDIGPILSGVVALVAVVIGPLISVWVAKQQAQTAQGIANLQAQTSVLSKSRQEWINSLRNEIAGFLSLITAINLEMLKEPPVLSSEFGKHIIQMRLHYEKIQLHINPNDSEHNALMSKMHAVLDCCLNFANEQMPDEVNKLSDELVDISQGILKKEWERVKKFS